MITLFQAHVQRWVNCTACPLHQGRLNVVLSRGTVPCDVLFIGEAPGKSEDVHGEPFVGKAGWLLNYIISRSVPPDVDYAISNLVACIPRNSEGDKTAVPLDEDVHACSERLLEFIEVANPRLIVCVGKVSSEWLDQSWSKGVRLPRKIPMVSIVHPAAILRLNKVLQSDVIKRSIVIIRDAIDKYLTR